MRREQKWQAKGNICSELALKAALPEANPAFHGKDRQVSTHINQTDRHTLCEIRDAAMPRRRKLTQWPPQGFAGSCFQLYFLVLSGEGTESTRALDKEQAHSHYLGRGRAAQRKEGNIFMGILVRHADSIVQAQTLASSTMSEDVKRKLQYMNKSVECEHI